ncbi:MATE family efflux transporter [Actinomarinicola tropica]|uniref:MATE family efflux transporter n=1 Tax=Actinomarinicola tropica TaxID=2789776 RepID=A0A5Q2RIN9_9ACTN|nr:MATE family efflux transporter [Actinomarinicola tropica]
MTRRLVRQPLDREILRLAVPALGALIAEPLYILADTAVVGRLGTDRLAGLALASTVLLVGYSIFIFLAYGTTAAVSRRLGAGDESGAAHQAVQSLWLAGLIGIAIAGAVAVGAVPLLRALGGEGEVLGHATTYLRISLLGMPAMLLVLAGTGYLRGLQDTRTPLLIAVASAATNLVVELVLVFGLGFDIGASAAATVVAQVGSAACYLLIIQRAVRVHATRLRPHWPTIARLGVVGRDLFVRTVALRGAIVATTAAAARSGTSALAAHQITFEVWNLMALTLDAVAIAGQAMVGRHLGAGDSASARAVGDRIIRWGLGTGVVLGAVLLAGHRALPSLFTDDGTVVAIGGSLLVVAAVAQPLNGVVFALDGLLIGAGDMTWLAVAMALATGGYLPLVGAVVALDLGVAALWWSFTAFMAMRLATLLGRWRGGRWAVVGVA